MTEYPLMQKDDKHENDDFEENEEMQNKDNKSYNQQQQQQQQQSHDQQQQDEHVQYKNHYHNPYQSLKIRYDTITRFLLNVQMILDVIVSFMEKINALITWRDYVATWIFSTLLLIIIFIIAIFGLQLCLCIGFCYLFRPPFMRTKLPGAPINFFHRLPCKSDQML